MTYTSFAAQDSAKSEDSGKQKLAPLVSGGQIEVGESRPTDDKVEEAKDQLLLGSQSAEVVRDGTTSWGADADQTFYFPTILEKSFLTIRSKADTVVIKSISVNRGNCPAFAFGLPAPIKFGKTFKILVMCDPLEAIVDTDRGSYSFGWQQ